MEKKILSADWQVKRHQRNGRKEEKRCVFENALLNKAIV